MGISLAFNSLAYQIKYRSNKLAISFGEKIWLSWLSLGGQAFFSFLCLGCPSNWIKGLSAKTGTKSTESQSRWLDLCASFIWMVEVVSDSKSPLMYLLSVVVRETFLLVTGERWTV